MIKILRWETPPKNKYDEAVETMGELRKKPGKWALIGEDLGAEADELETLLIQASRGDLETKITGYPRASLYARVTVSEWRN